MNFFEHQARARRSSTRMLVLFALAVLGIVAAVDLAVLLLLGGPMRREGDLGGVAGLLAIASAATLGVIGLGSLYRIASLRGGGEAVALEMGGTEVPQDTTDFQLRRLRNVVEEVAIAAGVPVPKLYVMEREAGINAFAAGYAPTDAVVAVTRGALERLNRDELQGVVAHEFSHILNGDMRLNIRLMGVLFGILMLSLVGRKVLQFGGGRGSRSAGAVLVFAVVAVVVGSLGVLFGRLIKAGVSRQREYLADASAVQFTRQTTGIAGALKKIGGVQAGSRLNDRAQAEEVAHMLFGEGLGYSRLFATHPPLAQRIRRLEPSFDPQELDTLRARWMLAPPDGAQEDIALGLAPSGQAPDPAMAGGALPGAAQTLPITPSQVSSQVAAPADDDHRRAHALVQSLSPELRALAQRRETVMPLLLGLLLDGAGEVAAPQRAAIAARIGDAAAAQALALRRRHLDALHPMLRLPLASLAFPVLRMRPRPELEEFLATMDALVHADGRISLFEYCLARLLQVQVREALDPSRHIRFGRRKPGSVRREFATLLAVVAETGSGGDRAAAQRAYLAGLQRVLPRDHVPYAPPAEGVLALDEVWAPLDQLDPLAKQVVVEAITDAIAHDGRVTVAEAELLRTVCAVLHCPLPAMLERP